MLHLNAKDAMKLVQNFNSVSYQLEQITKRIESAAGEGRVICHYELPRTCENVLSVLGSLEEQGFSTVEVGDMSTRSHICFRIRWDGEKA